MLIYDRFVFIHMPKTAGTYLTDTFARELPPPVKTLEVHTGWEAIPPEAAGLPVLMFVRNPWDWYVSWYHFLPGWLATLPPERFHENRHFQVILGKDLELRDGELRGLVDFTTVVRNSCIPPTTSHPLFMEMLSRGQPVAKLLQGRPDHYSNWFEKLAGAGLNSDQLTIGRFESLLDDLQRFMVQNEIPLADGAMQRIRASSPLNVTDHRPYREYYDAELRDLVGRSCRLIERFGYRF